MTVYCKCDDPVMDVEHDAGCRRCGNPVDFGPVGRLERATGRRGWPADRLEWVGVARAVCPRCGDPCHESYLRTIDDGAAVLGCGFCLDTDVPAVVLTGFLGGPR